MAFVSAAMLPVLLLCSSSILALPRSLDLIKQDAIVLENVLERSAPQCAELKEIKAKEGESKIVIGEVSKIVIGETIGSKGTPVKGVPYCKDNTAWKDGSWLGPKKNARACPDASQDKFDSGSVWVGQMSPYGAMVCGAGEEACASPGAAPDGPWYLARAFYGSYASVAGCQTRYEKGNDRFITPFGYYGVANINGGPEICAGKGGNAASMGATNGNGIAEVADYHSYECVTD